MPCKWELVRGKLLYYNWKPAPPDATRKTPRFGERFAKTEKARKRVRAIRAWALKKENAEIIKREHRRIVSNKVYKFNRGTSLEWMTFVRYHLRAYLERCPTCPRKK